MTGFDPSNRAEGWQPSIEDVYEFVRGQPHGRIASVDKFGQPYVANVAFSVTDDGDIIVGTSESSHKAVNIGRDKRVAMETTDAEQRYTVQLEGQARVLDPAEFNEKYAEEHYRQLPDSRPFRDQPGEVNILITPYKDHLRFSDCSVNPWRVSQY